MKYPFDYIIYFDGACEPINPSGNMGFGYAIFDKDGNTVKKHSSFVKSEKTNTNNVAEYMALILALKYIIENRIKGMIYIRGDSMLVVNQMNGKWGIKSGHYVTYAYECKELIKQIGSFNLKWIPREKNTIADDLSKMELLKHKVKINARHC